MASRPLPRLIATDLDGTLLDPRGELTPRTAAALQAVADRGVLVVFATGRPPMVAGREIAAAGRGVHYGVMANGTIICRLPDAEVLHSVSFDAALAFAAVHHLRAIDPLLGFALATDRGFSAEAGFHERMPVGSGDSPAVVDVLDGHDGAATAIKLLAFHPHHDAHHLSATLPAVLAAAVGPLAVSHMGANAVEIAPAGADKGRGLAWLLAHLGIDGADAMVFGDEVNDLPMFAVAGRRIAVGNAHALVRDAADEVAPPNSEEGVAVVLEALLAGG